MELLADLDEVTSEKGFEEFRKRLELALQVSKGKVFEEPRLLICTDVLKIPFPASIPRLPVESLGLHMRVIQRAPSLKHLREGRIPWRSGYVRLTSLDAIGNVVVPVKEQWIRQVHKFADTVFPEWRTCYAKTGRRLPSEMRKGIDRKAVFEARSVEFAKAVLEMLEANIELQPEFVFDMRAKLDPVLRFTAFVVDQFMERSYSLEKHHSDVFDQFQLHYLALDRFIIVTNDADLWNRTAGSPQASRIMSFETFLRTLS